MESTYTLNYIKLPHCPEKQLVKHNQSDVGWDIYLTEDTLILPFSQIPFDEEKDEYKFPLQRTGIILVPDAALEHSSGTASERDCVREGLRFDHWFAIYPRSSVVKKGVQLANSVGIIDPMYTGELFLTLYSLHKPILLKAEKAIAQLVITPNIPSVLKQIEEDPRTVQRGGFGSTDMKKDTGHRIQNSE